MNPALGIGSPPARILIVDDEPHNRQLLEVMLTPEGFFLQTAASGEEVLAILARQPPDLILLDIMMPGMDGYQVVAKIKGDVATKNIPVIIVTALDDRNARIRGLNAGAEEFLTKPVDRVELCARVKNLLHLKAYADYFEKYSRMLERQVASRTADLAERTAQAAVLAEQAALLDLAQDAILVRDMHDRILFWSRGAERLYGWPSQEALGKNTSALLKVESSELTDHIEATLLRQGQWEGEATHHKRDGTQVIVASRLALQRDAEGKPVRILIINNDITGRKQIESERLLLAERLQQAQRMEAVGALAGGVAHEVNNMMAVVMGTSEFLLQDACLPAGCLADVREIMKAADRAGVVTRQLLAFGRRAVNHPRRVELGAFVRDVESVVRRLLGEDRQLVVVVDATPRVWVDPGQLEQVLVNLILNARDATPPGGTITIIVSESTLPHAGESADGTVIPAGSYATLVVRDTGTGMDAETQSQIFDPFFTTKSVGKGTGLGLAAGHGIVAQNDGYITVASALGQGAAFTVYLPALPAAADTEHDEEPPCAGVTVPHAGGAATYAGATVLVVDDESVVRAIVARTLERGGFHVLQAADGADALELVDRHGPPHLVLTDVLMPGIGGAELARRLRECWPTLPILFMSGYSAEELGRRGAIASEGDVIQKPFTLVGLVESVAGTLSRVEAC